MTPADYAAWLAGGEKSQSMAEQGARLFDQFSCATCHTTDTKGLGPSLAGLYGKPQKLQTGETRIVDETMIREAILTPNAIQVPGFAAVMPTYKGQMDEEQMLQLIAYIKSLGSPERNQK
jgi:cytochrome c oxidase subunit II